MTLSCRVLTAKKEHKCSDCNRTIQVGEKYVRLFGSSDDNLRDPPPYELKQCKICGRSAITAHSEGAL